MCTKSQLSQLARADSDIFENNHNSNTNGNSVCGGQSNPVGVELFARSFLCAVADPTLLGWLSSPGSVWLMLIHNLVGVDWRSQAHPTLLGMTCLNLDNKSIPFRNLDHGYHLGDLN